ncbi:cadherin domain-containing protein [Maricaulis maris]|uniref:Serralysin n=1 Tax=Maricaulis maris TaxID=74318 RepID=A0A495DM64_9PROT|nr:cadherin domain-containing protein [Maricaulis maris]RKR03730.1 serralysin [Maricaulis maris]
MPAANKTNRQSTVRNALLSTALATGGALMLAGGAQAQEPGATPPDGFTPVSGVDGVARVAMGADGSVELVMADGRTVLIAAEDVTVLDGVVYLSDAALEANALLEAAAGAAAGGGGGGAVLGLLGGVGLLGAAAGGGGGGGGSSPTPTPPPTNTNPPVFTSAETAGVDENVTGTIYTATATDADGNSVSFSISGGADASLFSINSTTGAVTFNAPPDFENPADSGGDNDYVITIRASDGTNTTDQTVTITVGNVDETPVFSSGASASVDENDAGTVYTATATDPEGEAVTYSLGGTDAALFTIDAATGAVSFVAAPDFENPGDANGDNVYEVIVTASDGTTSSTQAVSITVNGVEEGPASFTSGTATSFDENGTGVVYTATTTDPDNDTITYSLGTAGDSALFAIDAATGELTFLTAPDFEAPADGNADNVYEVEIQANDGTATTTHTVSVTVDNVDEAPAITSGATASVAENTAGTVYTATATDPEGATLTYSVTGADAALFSIDANTGAVSFLAPPDFETPLDADGDNVYEITVNASDGANTVTQAVSISVTNVNEFAPVFSSAAVDTVAEDSVGSFYTAAATDGDGDTLTYSIAASGDGALFQIDSATGELSFVSSPDFENPADANADNVYELTLQASDGSTTTTHALVVTVTNVNAAPVITSSATANFVENGGGTAYTVTATDGDGDAIVYSIGGTDAALFAINAATGAVSFLVSPDFEAPADDDGDNVYDITVTASDGLLSDTESVAISVTNENDVAPVITSAASASTAENNSGTVYTATATDAEGDTISYTITGTDAALFQINASTGAVSFLTPPDFESPADNGGDNVYDFTVVASDGTLTDTQAVSITVTDVDEANAPVFSSAASQSVSENQTSAYVATATDPQGDTVSYSISGTDSALFSIDAATGEVTFNAAPDAEAPGDANADGNYEFTVTASDGSASNNLSVTVTVDNIDDAAEIPDNDSTEISMVSGGSYVGNLETAGDEDWIRVELVAGQRYEFNLTGTGAEEVEDPLIRLFDASGDLIAENDDISLGSIRDSRLAFTAETSGTYYIEVDSWDGGSTDERTGEYTFEFHHVDPLSAWNYQEIGDYLNANGFGGLQWDRSTGDTITVNITALTTDGQTLARAALQLWSDITGITFSEVATGGEITFDDDEEGAFAGPDTTSGGFITSASVNVGTGWLSTYGTNLDGYSFQTYIHEIGHALGLGHGGPYDGSADYAVDAIYLNDSWQASIMSYFSQNENTYVDASFGYVIGPQVADIIAVHDMYGASTTTRSGDTVYGYNSTAGNTIFDATAFTNPVSFTIFDAGGTDTLDYSGSGADQILDLREQAYSSVQGRTGNVGIAKDTVIENAIGGSGDDILVGNDADNTLTGNGGADTFYASGGTDVFDGGSGNDTVIFSGASSEYSLSTNGSGNTVVTDNRAGSPDGIVELISVETITYDGATGHPEYFGDPENAGQEGLDLDKPLELSPIDPRFAVSEDGGHLVMAVLNDSKAPDHGHDRHVYPHLSDDDLALLEALGDSDANAMTLSVEKGAVQVMREWALDMSMDIDVAVLTEKAGPVMETLTLPEATGLAITASQPLHLASFQPGAPGGESTDPFGAWVPALLDETPDGWA